MPAQTEGQAGACHSGAAQTQICTNERKPPETPGPGVTFGPQQSPCESISLTSSQSGRKLPPRPVFTGFRGILGQSCELKPALCWELAWSQGSRVKGKLGTLCRSPDRACHLA